MVCFGLGEVMFSWVLSGFEKALPERFGVKIVC